MADEIQTVTAPEVTVTPKAQPRPAPDTGMLDFSKDPIYQSYFKNVADAAAAYRSKIGQQTELESGLPKKREELLRPAIEKLGVAAEAERPKPPTLEKQPEVPSLKPRPFGTIAPGSDVAQAFQQLVGGLSSVVLAFAGMKAPVAALNSLSGAMEGWAEGDLIRAQRQWKEYEGKVAKIQRDNEVALTEYDLARTQRADDREAAQLLFQARMSEFGLNEYAAQVGERGMERSAQLWQMTNAQLQQYQKMAEQTIGHRLQYLRLLETIQAHGDTQQHREFVEEHTLKGEERAGRTEKRTEKYQERQIEHMDTTEQQAQEREHRLQRQEVLAAKKAKDTEAYRKEMLALNKDRLALSKKVKPQVLKMWSDTEEGLITTDMFLDRFNQLEQDVNLLYSKGLIPKGATLFDKSLAELSRQRHIKDPEIGGALDRVKSFGTAEAIGLEMQLQGNKVGAARIKSIAEAEVKDMDLRTKNFWDDFFKTGKQFALQRKSMLERKRDMIAPMIPGLSDPELLTFSEEESPAVQWEATQ